MYLKLLIESNYESIDRSIISTQYKSYANIMEQ